MRKARFTSAANGVRFIFTLCGGHIQAIYDGCLDDGIRVVDVRHEQTAGHAADGYARMTGKPLAPLPPPSGSPYGPLPSFSVSDGSGDTPVLPVTNGPPLQAPPPLPPLQPCSPG